MSHLIGVEAVVYKHADEVQVQSLHVFHTPGRFLKSWQAHIKVDFIQVSTVKCIKLRGQTQNISSQIGNEK